MSSSNAPGQRLGFDRGTQAFIYGAGIVVGVGVGLAIPFLTAWASDLPWVPFSGPLTLLGSLSPAWALPVVGGLLGAGFAMYVIYESPVLYVSDQQIEVHASGELRHINREQVVGVFREGGNIVVEGPGGRTLFRGRASNRP